MSTTGSRPHPLHQSGRIRKEGGISLTDRPQNRQQARQRRKPIDFGEELLRPQPSTKSVWVHSALDGGEAFASPLKHAFRLGGIDRRGPVDPTTEVAGFGSERRVRPRAFGAAPPIVDFHQLGPNADGRAPAHFFRNLLASASRVGSPAANFAPVTGRSRSGSAAPGNHDDHIINAARGAGPRAGRSRPSRRWRSGSASWQVPRRLRRTET